MNQNRLSRKIRALGLCSGGLDSILSALVLKKQGIDVTWISFTTPFFSSASAQNASRKTGVPLIIEDITDSYMEMLVDPPAGYGKNMNPCMDCHALMFNRAGSIMEKEGFDFLFSGEVAGQRPFSQNKRSLRYVEKRSGFDGLILRPLSAKILPETSVEKSGLVDREKLSSISGRSRKPQIEMAKQFGVTSYPAPAGGCLLTDAVFSRRLRDLMVNQKDFKKRDLELLKSGRHFRLGKSVRAIIGRSKEENDLISSWFSPDTDILLRHAVLPGPILLIPSGAPSEMVKTAASMCAGYTKTRPGAPADICVRYPGGESVIRVAALDPLTFQEFMI